MLISLPLPPNSTWYLPIGYASVFRSSSILFCIFIPNRYARLNLFYSYYLFQQWCRLRGLQSAENCRRRGEMRGLCRTPQWCLSTRNSRCQRRRRLPVSGAFCYLRDLEGEDASQTSWSCVRGLEFGLLLRSCSVIEMAFVPYAIRSGQRTTVIFWITRVPARGYAMTQRSAKASLGRSEDRDGLGKSWGWYRRSKVGREQTGRPCLFHNWCSFQNYFSLHLTSSGSSVQKTLTVTDSGL